MRRLTDLDPNLTHFICMGPFCWGRGTSIPEAIANAKKEYYPNTTRGKWKQIIFACDSEAFVDGLGRINYDPDCPPVVIEDEHNLV
jgi:hypothetical protein